MTSNLADQAEAYLNGSDAYSHQFLSRLRQEGLNDVAAKNFAIQWYKAATAHKRAFPGLVYNTEDDTVRVQLITILHEEYGFGDTERVHARILENFLEFIGVDPSATADVETNPKVAEFSEVVDYAWSKKNSAYAFGVHFALEFLAANMHKSFYYAVQTLPGVTPEAIEYFKIHSVAEDEHAALARMGMEHLSNKSEVSSAQLMAGVREGTRIVAVLLDGLEDSVVH